MKTAMSVTVFDEVSAVTSGTRIFSARPEALRELARSRIDPLYDWLERKVMAMVAFWSSWRGSEEFTDKMLKPGVVMVRLFNSSGHFGESWITAVRFSSTAAALLQDETLRERPGLVDRVLRPERLTVAGAGMVQKAMLATARISNGAAMKTAFVRFSMDFGMLISTNILSSQGSGWHRLVWGRRDLLNVSATPGCSEKLVQWPLSEG